MGRLQCHVLEQRILGKISAFLLVQLKYKTVLIQILLNKGSGLLKLEDDEIHFLLRIYNFFFKYTYL